MPMAFTTANGTGDVARQLFLAAERVNMRIITGARTPCALSPALAPPLIFCHHPDVAGTQAQNRYTPDDGFVEKTHELFKWLYYERSDGAKPPPHRSLYGINFRFAPSSSFEQFADLEELMREYRYPNDPNPPAIDKGRDPDGKGAYVLTHMVRHGLSRTVAHMPLPPGPNFALRWVRGSPVTGPPPLHGAESLLTPCGPLPT